MTAGLRKSAEPRKHNAQQMVDFAHAMTDAEIAQAAAYYGALPPTVRIKVVETATVPKMRSQEGMWLPDDSGAREAIDNRVIETPADVRREQLRDPHAGFIAYAPRGAVAKGNGALAAGPWPRFLSWRKADRQWRHGAGHCRPLAQLSGPPAL